MIPQSKVESSRRKDEDIREFVNVRITETAETGYTVGGEVIG